MAAASVIEEAPELAKDRREWWRRKTKFRAVFPAESWVTLTLARLEQLGPARRTMVAANLGRIVVRRSRAVPAVLPRQSVASDSSCGV
jgi:hypothetical protein